MTRMMTTLPENDFTPPVSNRIGEEPAGSSVVYQQESAGRGAGDPKHGQRSGRHQRTTADVQDEGGGGSDSDGGDETQTGRGQG